MALLTGRARAFLDLHVPGDPLLQPNAWDVGSARILEDLGFAAVATTSSGHAATLGRPDGSVTRDEALAHGRQLASAVSIAVSADLEDGFSDRPDEVAETVRMACEAGLAGCSIEDFTRRVDDPIHDVGLAVERVAAAAEAAHRGPDRIVLTARAENHVHGRDDLADTIARLQAYQEAGADVLFAPGIIALDDVRALVTSVDRPVNVLALPGCAPLDDLADAGVARISVGGGLAWVAYGALIGAAVTLLEDGSLEWWGDALRHRQAIREALQAPHG